MDRSASGSSSDVQDFELGFHFEVSILQRKVVRQRTVSAFLIAAAVTQLQWRTSFSGGGFHGGGYSGGGGFGGGGALAAVDTAAAGGGGHGGGGGALGPANTRIASTEPWTDLELDSTFREACPLRYRASLPVLH